MADTYVFFLPEMSTYFYARMLSLYADALQRQGKPVYFLACKGGLDACWPKNRLAAEGSKRSVGTFARCCRECLLNQRILRHRYGLRFRYIDDLLGAEDLQGAKNVVANCRSLKEFVYDGVAVGIQAQYDLILLFKDCNLELTPLVEELLQSQILANIKIGMAVRKLTEEFAIRAFVYTQNYNAQAALRNACSAMNIVAFQIDAPLFLGYSGDRHYISKNILRKEMEEWLECWGRASSLPIPESSVKDCFSDVFFRNFGASGHLFSPNKIGDPRDILSKFSITADRKILVAYTSSTDEIAAAESICSTLGYALPFRHIFPSQIEWIIALADYAKERNHQLVVRIHPRMGGSDNRSPQLAEFQRGLRNLPECCRVIWPNDPVSSYDLAELADVALTSWSTMSQELSRIGVPCVAATKTSAYPDAAFLRCPATEAEYFKQIDAVLNNDFCLSTMVEAVRFSNFTQALTPFVITKGVSQQCPPSIFQDKPFPRIPDDQLSLVLSFFEGKTTPLEFNITQMRRSVNFERVLEEEKRAIFEGVGHYIESVFAPRPSTSPPFASRIKRFVKGLLPVFMSDIVMEIWRIVQRIFPAHFHRSVYIPHWDARILCVSIDASMESVFMHATFANKTLRVLLIVDSCNVVYFRHGNAVPRASKLMARLGWGLLNNYSCRWGG